MIKKSLDCLVFSLDKGNDWKKSDLRKVAIATLLKTKTEVTNRWIATRLEMGHENSINRHRPPRVINPATNQAARNPLNP